MSAEHVPAHDVVRVINTVLGSVHRDLAYIGRVLEAHPDVELRWNTTPAVSLEDLLAVLPEARVIRRPAADLEPAAVFPELGRPTIYSSWLRPWSR